MLDLRGGFADLASQYGDDADVLLHGAGRGVMASQKAGEAVADG